MQCDERVCVCAFDTKYMCNQIQDRFVFMRMRTISKKIACLLSAH